MVVSLSSFPPVPLLLFKTFLRPQFACPSYPLLLITLFCTCETDNPISTIWPMTCAVGLRQSLSGCGCVAWLRGWGLWWSVLQALSKRKVDIKIKCNKHTFLQVSTSANGQLKDNQCNLSSSSSGIPFPQLFDSPYHHQDLTIPPGKIECQTHCLLCFYFHHLTTGRLLYCRHLTKRKSAMVEVKWCDAKEER